MRIQRYRYALTVDSFSVENSVGSYLKQLFFVENSAGCHLILSQSFCRKSSHINALYNLFRICSMSGIQTFVHRQLPNPVLKCVREQNVLEILVMTDYCKMTFFFHNSSCFLDQDFIARVSTGIDCFEVKAASSVPLFIGTGKTFVCRFPVWFY